MAWMAWKVGQVYSDQMGGRLSPLSLVKAITEYQYKQVRELFLEIS
jgi:hypothetical protein